MDGVSWAEFLSFLYHTFRVDCDHAVLFKQVYRPDNTSFCGAVSGVVCRNISLLYAAGEVQKKLINTGFHNI